MRRLGIGIVAAAALVVAAGMWAPAQAALTEYSIDSPASGEVTSTRTVNVQMSAASDSSSGLQYVRLELEGPGFSRSTVWCAPGPAPSCPSWSSGQQTSYTGTFGWDTKSLTTYNGEYTLKLIAKDNSGDLRERSNHIVKVNTPPAAPSWVSVTPTTSGGNPQMILKWKANSEPDIKSYKVTRSSSNGGPNYFFSVDAGSPPSHCSKSGDTYTCSDSLPSSGYSGTYTYHLAATRNSPVTSAGVSSSQSSRSAAITEPSATPTGGGGGGGGGGGSRPTQGGGSTPGGNPFTNDPSPASTYDPALDPDYVDPGYFSSGTYAPTLPYQDRTTVVMGEQSVRRIPGFTGEEEAIPLDVRKTLLPVAGGLFTLTAALHFRRIIRDH